MEEERVRQVVVPGEVIGDGKKPGYGTYEENGKIISKFLGVLQESDSYLSVVPLSGVYTPKIRDKIIGVVTDVEKAGWIVDINAPWQGFLSLSEALDEFVDIKRVSLNRFYDVGDVVYGEVVDIRRGDVQLSVKSPMSRKLKGGFILKITPTKVPRLIGKDGSMVNLIKEKTNTMIRVGQNGVVWIDGENIDKAVKSIKLIEEKSHIFGLTAEISKMLSE